MSVCEATDALKELYVSRIPKPELAADFIWPGMVCSYKKILSMKELEFGENDVIIASYPKSGTTWASELVSAIAHEGDTEILKQIRMDERVPWMELDFEAIIANLDPNAPLISSATPVKTNAKKRVVFTHLHPHFLPQSVLDGKCKLIYVARNPKDTAVSFYHFHLMTVFLGKMNMTWAEYFPLFCSGYLCSGSWFKQVVSYWNLAKTNKNVKFLKYEDMKKDLMVVMEELETFIGVPLTKEQRVKVVDHCSFSSMKDNKMTNRDTLELFDNKISNFMRKGIVGDWKNYFTVAQNEAFEELYKKELEGTGLSFEFK